MIEDIGMLIPYVLGGIGIGAALWRWFLCWIKF